MRVGGVGTVERAYQLAKSGQFRGVTEIQRQLSLEGFGDAHLQLSTRALTNDLRRIMKSVQPPPSRSPEAG